MLTNYPLYIFANLAQTIFISKAPLPFCFLNTTVTEANSLHLARTYNML